MNNVQYITFNYNQKNLIMKHIPLILCLILFLACTPKKQPIRYGEDVCIYCKMNIVEKRYGTEMVTKKAKVYKYDAIECLINHIQDKEFNQKDVALLFITPFDKPGTLYDATKATYLRSPKLPSPMGMFLTAFSTKEKAVEKKNELGGEIYNWKELTENYISIVSKEIVHEED